MMESLMDRIAVVTGAAQGIGRAMAERLLAEGAFVLLADNKETVVQLAEDLGDRAHAMVVDVASSSDVLSMIDTAYAKWGRIDALCNNAGVDGAQLPLAECPDEQFDKIISVNLKGVFFGMKHVLPIMEAAGGGSIINTASAAGLVGFTGLSVYSASKHAVVGLTKATALEYGSKGIRVNAICPGGVLTPMAEAVLQSDENYALWAQKHALRRFAQPSEIGALAAFLASDDSSYITGATIAIDGGYTAE